MVPIIIANILVTLSCIKIGINITPAVHDVKMNVVFSERSSSLRTRLFCLFLAVVGVYPQYKAVKTVLIGRGWISGNWEQEHQDNQKTLYIIEPVIEALLQVLNFKF